MKHQPIVFLHDTDIDAHVDPDETEIVMTNLIENAHKYSPKGSPIHIHAHIAYDQVVVSVRDEGVGIATTDIDAIFEKFKRVDNPLSDTVAGNGLGLYWVKRIVSLHGGTLDVVSEISKGTTFTVHLPL